LELVCFYNNQDDLEEDWIEERWYTQANKDREEYRNTWKYVFTINIIIYIDIQYIILACYIHFNNHIILFYNNNFRSNGFAMTLFSSIKSPNSHHYSIIIQGMAKYNQVK